MEGFKSSHPIAFRSLTGSGIYVVADPQKKTTDTGILLHDEALKDKGVGTVVLVSEDMPNCKVSVGDRIMYRTVSTLCFFDDPTERHVLVEYRDVIGVLE